MQEGLRPFGWAALEPVTDEMAKKFAQADTRRTIDSFLRLNLFPFHEIPDVIMAADKEKDNLVGEFKENSVLESGADFPVVAMPVFEPEAVRKFSLAIHILYERVNGLISFFLTGGGEFLEAPVKVGLKFVSHVTSSGVLGVCERQRSLCSERPALFSTDQAWQPAFCNLRD